MAKKLKTYNVLVKALDNFSLVNLDINVFNKKGENVFKTIKESVAEVRPASYLAFVEENNDPFALKTSNLAKNWDGVLEYSTDTKNWSEWGGNEISSSSNGKLYLRGTGNTYITDENSFILTTNKRIQCLGNIENLLDYKTVEAGDHPVMSTYCYARMFQDWTSLTTTPELPATALSDSCYYYMFRGCTSLTTTSELPATALSDSCYGGMFQDCTSLIQAPKLPAITLAINCYRTMFYGCTSLTGTIHCPASTASNEYRLDAKTTNIPVNTATVVYDL